MQCAFTISEASQFLNSAWMAQSGLHHNQLIWTQLEQSFNYSTTLNACISILRNHFIRQQWPRSASMCGENCRFGDTVKDRMIPFHLPCVVDPLLLMIYNINHSTLFSPTASSEENGFSMHPLAGGVWFRLNIVFLIWFLFFLKVSYMLEFIHIHYLGWLGVTK